MPRDEFGMPLPDHESEIPWNVGEEVCKHGRLIRAKNGSPVAQTILPDVDPQFIVFAANNIRECREIVRRMIEWHRGPIDKHVSLCDIVADAEKLWSKMQKESGDE